MSCLSDDAAICRRRYGIDMPDPQPPVRYCVYWEDPLTARIRQHYSTLAAARALPWSSLNFQYTPPLAWLRVDPTTQEVHVYSSAVEIRDRRWFATLPTIEDAVNFCHAARSLLYAAEDDANAIGDARRGYSRIMPHQEWAPYEIYEVTWHYQPATE